MWRTALIFEGRSAGASAFLAEALCCAGCGSASGRGRLPFFFPHGPISAGARCPRAGGGGLSPQPAQGGAAAQVGFAGGEACATRGAGEGRVRREARATLGIRGRRAGGRLRRGCCRPALWAEALRAEAL